MKKAVFIISLVIISLLLCLIWWFYNYNKTNNQSDETARMVIAKIFQSDETPPEKESFDMRKVQINPQKYIGKNIYLRGIVIGDIKRQKDDGTKIRYGVLYSTISLENGGIINVIFREKAAEDALQFKNGSNISFQAMILTDSGGTGDYPIVVFKSF